MSKVVKGVGRAVSKVVKGVANVAKKVVKSPIGKVLVGAALVYFGGAALMGAIGGASAGAAAGTGVMGTLGGAVSGGLSGAAAGISNAWAGLTGALSGGGMSALGQGFTGSYGAGAGSVAQAAQTASQLAANSMVAGNPVVNATNPALIESAAGSTGYGVSTATPGFQATNLAKPGLISGAWESLGPYGKAAAISGGTQLVGGVIQGAGMQKAQERQEELAAEERARQEQAVEDARARYNRNIGTRLWG